MCVNHNKSKNLFIEVILQVLLTTVENMSFYMYFKAKKWAKSISTEQF